MIVVGTEVVTSRVLCGRQLTIHIYSCLCYTASKLQALAMFLQLIDSPDLLIPLLLKSVDAW
jgi:hypothetical protein